MIHTVDIETNCQNLIKQKIEDYQNIFLEEFKTRSNSIQEEFKNYKNFDEFYDNVVIDVININELVDNVDFYKSYYKNECCISEIIKLLKIQNPNNVVISYGAGGRFEQIVPKFVFDIIKNEKVSVICLEMSAVDKKKSTTWGSPMELVNDILQVNSDFNNYIDEMFKKTDTEAYRVNLNINLFRITVKYFYFQNSSLESYRYSFLMTLLYDMSLNGINDFSLTLLDGSGYDFNSELNLFIFFKILEKETRNGKIKLKKSLIKKKMLTPVSINLRQILCIYLLKNSVNIIALKNANNNYIYMPKMLNENVNFTSDLDTICYYGNDNNDCPINSLSYDEITTGSFRDKKFVASGGTYLNKYLKYKAKYLKSVNKI